MERCDTNACFRLTFHGKSSAREPHVWKAAGDPTWDVMCPEGHVRGNIELEQPGIE